MLKTFIIGIVLGIVAGAAALYAYPVVDQHREASIVSVAPNGRNTESFHVNVPMDRILVGVPGQEQALPPGMEWPGDPVLRDVRVELFKLRNARDIVVGIASRTVVKQEPADVIDWVMHFPARGSVYASIRPESLEGGFRQGEFRAGSREFAILKGSMTERWVKDTSGNEDAPAGRIELTTTYVGSQEGL